jgi:hypothetical protein
MAEKYNGQSFDVNEGCKRFKVKKNITAGMGDIAVMSGGYVTVGASGTSLKFVGTFAEDVDTNALANDGDAYGEYIGPQVNFVRDTREFWFDNSTAGDAITQADCGKVAYINGARSVTDTSTSRSVAGTIMAISPDAAHVKIAGQPFGIGL